MYLKQSYDQQFVDLFFYLKSKYDESLFELEGIGSDNLDLPKYAKKFFTINENNKNVADKSIDSNANISDTPSVINFTVESVKPGFKLNSFYMLWKQAKRLYNLSIANNLIESTITGDIYINDSSNLMFPYCYNYSTLKVAQKGLPGVNKIHSDPPKHLFSFFGQIENFIILASNNTLGASGIADLLVTTSIYMDRILKTQKDTSFKFASEDDCWTYLKENITSFIYIVNQNFRSNQSAFTNVSLYDSEFLKEMIDSYKLLIDDELYEAKIEIINRIQEIYIDCFNEVLRRTPCTFPVTTSCSAIDENYDVIDKKFLSMIAEKNTEFGFINIYSGKSSTLSSCCFNGDEFIEVVNKNNIKEIISIKKFVEQFLDNNKNPEIKKIQTDYKIKSYNPKTLTEKETEITGVLKKVNKQYLIEIKIGDKIIKVTEDHIFIAKNIKTDEIVEIRADFLLNNFDDYLIPIQ